MHQTSHKPVSVTSQCLAVVLGKESTSGTDWSSTKSGHRVFQSFIDENRESFWNPALVESVCSLDFVGFMKPGTLLVSGSELHLECLRSAWARRVLKPPRGYQIKSLGDIGGIEMQEVPQTQFVPLPEVLCLVISQLNRVGHPATLDTIADEIAQEYPGMAVPGPEMLHAALSGLGTEGKVYCMGDHFFVSTPLMFQHYRQTAFGAAAGPPFSAYWGDSAPYHMGAVGAKQLQTLKQESCTRECQTGASIVNAPAYKAKTKKDQATLADVHECAAQNDENQRRSRKDDGVVRSRSIKDKDKKGFFARLFRRSRSREKVKSQEEVDQPASSSKTQPTTAPAPPVAAVDQPSNSLGTFSAQFPPTEWLYDPRLHLQSTHGKSRKRDKVALRGVFDPPKIADKKAAAGRLSSQRFCTFPENLNEETVAPPTAAVVPTRSGRKHHRAHFRQSKYLSSSSECLNYGPIDPPELLPNYADAEAAFDDVRRRRRRHRRSERVERLITSGRTDSTLRVLEAIDGPDDTTPRAHDLDGWLEREPSGGRTSTPVDNGRPALEAPLQNGQPREQQAGGKQQQLAVQPGGSDSAYSPSPVVTDMSNSSRDKFSSWSGSETAAKADPMDHTYINLDHRAEEIPCKERRVAHVMDMAGGQMDSSLESTRFEDVTNTTTADTVARQLSDTHLHNSEAPPRPTIKSVHISNV